MKKTATCMKKQYDNNVLVGTSRQGPALTDVPQTAGDSAASANIIMSRV